jgi:hypothetical protein
MGVSTDIKVWENYLYGHKKVCLSCMTSFFRIYLSDLKTIFNTFYGPSVKFVSFHCYFSILNYAKCLNCPMLVSCDFRLCLLCAASVAPARRPWLQAAPTSCSTTSASSGQLARAPLARRLQCARWLAAHGPPRVSAGARLHRRPAQGVESAAGQGTGAGCRDCSWSGRRCGPWRPRRNDANTDVRPPSACIEPGPAYVRAPPDRRPWRLGDLPCSGGRGMRDKGG